MVRVLAMQMSTSSRSRLHPWIVTLAALVIAIAVRAALSPMFAGQYPFITFFPAVAVVARYAGFRQAVLAVLVAPVAAAALCSSECY